MAGKVAAAPAERTLLAEYETPNGNTIRLYRDWIRLGWYTVRTSADGEASSYVECRGTLEAREHYTIARHEGTVFGAFR